MYEVIVRREMRPLVDALAGRKAGYADAYEQWRRDPCAIYPPGREDEDGRPFAYRLSGPLEQKVCGVHLKREYRLAFSMQRSDSDEVDGYVVLLYVGLRKHRRREQDIWTIVHDLFEVDNPPEDHLRPPCCDSTLPDVDQNELEDFMIRLRRLLR